MQRERQRHLGACRLDSLEKPGETAGNSLGRAADAQWQRQREGIEWWVGPIFGTWTQTVFYKRQWRGNAEPAQPWRAPIVWGP